MKHVLISLIIFLVGLTGILNPVRSAFNYSVSPVQFGLKKTAVSLHDIFTFYSNLSSLRRDNIKLLEDKIALESKIIELKKIGEENETLKKQLGIFDLGDKNKYILASVTGNPGDLSLSTVLINVGARQGVSKLDNVVLGKYLVGVVKEVMENRSVVELITSPTLSFSAYNIDTPEKTEGLVSGEHGSAVIVSKILPKERAEVGDSFVASGKEGLILPGLYVGKVALVNFSSSQPLKSVQLQTILDTTRLDQVFVLAQNN